ncbi:MAG: IPT/TIG domain-containing protein [Kofleriaceae bacterium]
MRSCSSWIAPGSRGVRRAAALLFLGTLWCATSCKSDGPLAVTGIEPGEGDYMGGTYVRIAGSRFTKDGARNAKIYFGSRQAGLPRFASDNEMIVEAPGGKIGETVDVLIIFEPGGELKIPNAFKYVEHKMKTIDDVSTKRKK